LAKNHPPLNIAIIGAGFCGLLTAIHLLQADGPLVHIHIINKGSDFGRGVAYGPHTSRLLLNVPNKGMSAFPDTPGHFLDWLIDKHPAENTDREKLASQFSPRKLYGEYLDEQWQNAIKNARGDKKLTICHYKAVNVAEKGKHLQISLDGHDNIIADIVVLATGNEHPNFVSGLSPSLKNSNLYFADPWKKDCIENLKDDGDILIIGNGLTTVDTVIGLADNGFKGIINTISPHGYRLKPWEETKTPYTVPASIAGHDTQLLQLFQTFNKHRKIADSLNQSIYPLVDSLRPKIQSLWLSFNRREKQQFIENLSSFWDRVRHRLPTQMHDIVEDMRTANKLVTHNGYIISAVESVGKIDVTLNTGGWQKYLQVQRIINCSGPQTNITCSNNELLKNMAQTGMITPGPFDLGINTHPEDCSVIKASGERLANLFVIGSNLKGMLWESTAVPELRVQAQKLAAHIILQARAIKPLFQAQS